MQNKLGSLLAVAATLSTTILTGTTPNRMTQGVWEGRQRNEQVIEQMLVQTGWMNGAPQSQASLKTPYFAETIKLSAAIRQTNR
jgi:hypothetical protein